VQRLTAAAAMVSIAGLMALDCAAQSRPKPALDFEVMDQNGRKVQFYRDVVAGKVVAIDFIFTSCATVCPTLGFTFARVEKLLGARAGEGVQLISVSVDPVSDTPEQLRHFATRSYERTGWHPDARAGWTLVTGEKRNVVELLRALGQYTPDKVLHSTTVLIGRGDGAWARVNALGGADKIAQRLLDEARR
jgi:protein SCO1/2